MIWALSTSAHKVPELHTWPSKLHAAHPWPREQGRAQWWFLLPWNDPKLSYYICIYIYIMISISLSLIICICIYIYVYYVCVWYSSILIYHQKIRKLRVQSLHPRGLVPRAATNLIRYSSLLSQLQDVSQVGQTEFDLHELKISLINWQHQGVSKHDIIWYLPIVACGFAVLSSNTLGKS